MPFRFRRSIRITPGLRLGLGKRSLPVTLGTVADLQTDGITLNNPGLPPSLWNALDGRLWHATGAKGFAGIIRDREIRVFHERYTNSLCKMLDGVSLMDFGPTAIHLPDQFENWREWFGHQQESRVAVWLEIDRRAVAHALLDAGAARALRRDNLGRQIILGVEACHKGAIPLTSVLGALLIDRHDREAFERLDMENASSAALLKFEDGLPPAPPESELLKAILAAEARLLRAAAAEPAAAEPDVILKRPRE